MREGAPHQNWSDLVKYFCSCKRWGIRSSTMQGAGGTWIPYIGLGGGVRRGCEFFFVTCFENGC
jgi:hypothetical protein